MDKAPQTPKQSVFTTKSMNNKHNIRQVGFIHGSDGETGFWKDTPEPLDGVSDSLIDSMQLSDNESPAGSGSSRQQPQFDYKPLDETKSEIRVLSILPDLDNQQVRCTLNHFPCTSTAAYPPFVALSYCWGDPDDTLPILVNDSVAFITKNLEFALRELRKRRCIGLWVDAICINQRDKDERGHQVLKMRDIYKNALETVVWLGPSHLAASHALVHLEVLATRKPRDVFERAVQELKSMRYHKLFHFPEWDALRVLMGLEYWERTWIIQEIVLSRSVSIIWGEKTIDFQTLEAGMLSLRELKPKVGFCPGYQEIMSLLRVCIDWRREKENSMDLIRVLCYSIWSRATDPRDKIFGVLGLCRDGPTLVPTPNYRQSLDTIFREVTIERLLHVEDSPWERGRIMDLICIDDPSFPRRDDLPSWANDWSTLWKSPDGDVSSSRTRRYLNSGYKACGQSQKSVQFSGDGLVLICRGYAFDSIGSLSGHVNEAPDLSHFVDPTNDPGSNTELTIAQNVYGSESELYEAIWRSLVKDRDSGRLNRAPNGYRRHFPRLWSVEGMRAGQKILSNFNDYLDPLGKLQIYDRTLEAWARSGVSAGSELNGQVDSANLQYHGEAIVAFESPLESFIEALVDQVFTQRFLVTKRGYVGLTHFQSKRGDIICLLEGGSVPMILRACEGGYRVVGEAYVHGIMDGQFWETQDEASMQEFRLK